MVFGTVSAIAMAAAFTVAAQTSDPSLGAGVQGAEATEDPLQQIPHTLNALADAKAGKYGTLRAEDRQLLDKADRDITELMQRHDDLHHLDAQEKTRLFNAQETIMGIVSGLKRTQLVCTYKQELGTRLKTRHCVTREMAEAIKRGARDSTHAMQNPMCVPGEGNSCG